MFIVKDKLPRHLSGCGLIIALVLSTAVADSANPTPGMPANSSIEVEHQDGLLSLRATNAPLVEVIDAIGQQAGFQTRVFGEIEHRLTRSFDARPLEQVLKQLLSGYSSTLHYDTAQSPRLTRVYLYGSASADTGNAYLPSAAPENVLVSGALDNETAAGVDSIQSLAVAGDPEAAAELNTLLREDPDPAVRGEVAGILADFGDAGSVSALAAGASDDNPQVRFRAIRGLAAINSDQSTQILAETMLNHNDTRTRLLAVWGLGKQGGPLAQSYLEAALNVGDAVIRQAVIRALNQDGIPVPEN